MIIHPFEKLLKTILHDEMISGFQSIFILPRVGSPPFFSGILGRNLKPHSVCLQPAGSEPSSGTQKYLFSPHSLTFLWSQKVPSCRWLSTKQAAYLLIPYLNLQTSGIDLVALVECHQMNDMEQ